MINSGALAGRTIFISGASRGIGEAIAVKCARDGANVAIAAKTAEPHPKLPGTIYTVAEKIEAAGGKALPCVVDIRFVNFLFRCSITSLNFLIVFWCNYFYIHESLNFSLLACACIIKIKLLR